MRAQVGVLKSRASVYRIIRILRVSLPIHMLLNAIIAAGFIWKGFKVGFEADEILTREFGWWVFGFVVLVPLFLQLVPATVVILISELRRRLRREKVPKE